MLDNFADALSGFDHIIILDIYAARETNTFDISSLDLVNKLNEKGKIAKYLPNFDEVVSYLKASVTPNDLVLTLGAGTVTNIGPMLLEK